jgi:O-antigen/teichoic acid export membrane protein
MRLRIRIGLSSCITLPLLLKSSKTVMSRSKMFKDLSANAVQTGIAQFVGLCTFYFMSRYISKEDFGSFNWSIAVGSTILAIGSMGLDLVLIKRISAGQDVRLLAGIHFFHTLLIGFLLLVGIFILLNVAPNLIPYQPLFLLVIIQLTITSVANSFKFTLTGLEAFKQLAIISVVINLIKLTTVIFLFLIDSFSILHILIGFIFTSIIELIHGYYFVNIHLKERLKPIIEKVTYKNFVVESLPQLGVVLFDSALARIDWILLGVFSTATITAEYSFAYKFFELSKIPLVILAPVLLTRFSKLLKEGHSVDKKKMGNIQVFFNIEMFISLLIPIYMVCAWPTLIDMVTANKYGSVNHVTYALLSVCVPIHFMINFLWTIGFVQGQLKTIMIITICSSLFNILVNVNLIPRMGALGAAYSFLGTSVLQLTIYFILINRKNIVIEFKNTLLLILLALSSVLLSRYFFANNYIAATVAIMLYTIIAFFAKLFKIDRTFLKSV